MIRIAVVGLLAAAGVSAAADKERAPAPRPVVVLPGYKSPKEAVKADPKAFAAGPVAGLPGYLGVQIGEDAKGKPVIDDVDAESPAAAAGFLAGDVVTAVAGVPVATAAAARDKLRGRNAGDTLAVAVARGGKAITLSADLRPLSKPFRTGGDRGVAGVQTDDGKGGAAVTGVTAGGGADKAGVKVGDVIIRVNAAATETDTAFRDAMTNRVPGEVLIFRVKRAAEELEFKISLAAATDEPAGRGNRAGASGWDDRLPTTFRKPAYRLAIIGVEYPDVKHSEKATPEAWEEALFSSRLYTGKSATGQTVYGSMNDYYKELSYGTLNVTGRFVGWVEAAKKKAEYNLGSSVSAADKSKYFSEVMEKVVTKFGKDSVKDFDGVFFIYAGDRVQTSRGGLYWPHRSNFSHAGKRWSYFIVPELSGKDRMTDISVICHEFGHMLGLPDLYARPELPGSEGVGVWCAMSNQLPNGRPQHFSAWSKEQMGWLKPTIVDPRVKQKLVLGPVEDSPTECFKIPARADMSEYFLLENRQRKGWDKELPADGLLIWRVIGGKPILEEAHGVDGPTGPRVFPGAVPFPSPANASFTPYTTPSSKSQLGGGLDVYITNVRRRADGRVTFHLGYEYQ